MGHCKTLVRSRLRSREWSVDSRKALLYVFGTNSVNRGWINGNACIVPQFASTAALHKRHGAKYAGSGSSSVIATEIIVSVYLCDYNEALIQLAVHTPNITRRMAAQNMLQKQCYFYLPVQRCKLPIPSPKDSLHRVRGPMKATDLENDERQLLE